MKRYAVFCTFFLCVIFLSIPLVISAQALTYKVKQGDNLHGIAKKHGITVNQLKSLNGLRSDRLSIGQALTIRKGTARAAANNPRSNTGSVIRAQQRTRQPEARPASASDSDDFITYRLKQGDTLGSIAASFDVDEEELIEINDLPTGKNAKLTPGRIILIPKIVEENEAAEEFVDLNNAPLKPWRDTDEKYMLVKVAKSFMGAPYKYGGNTVRGIDCSAYVKKIYSIFDIQLPRTAREQYRIGARITRNELAVGDLVFFKTRRYASYPTHVGIYIGEGNFIHASAGRKKLGVKIDSLDSAYYSKTYIGATRLKDSTDVFGRSQPEVPQPTT